MRDPRLVNGNFNLTEVQVAVLSPQQGLRRTLRDIMLSVGLTNFRDYENLNHLQMTLPEANPDLLILPLDYEREPVCDLIRDIRYGRTGRNPYVVILTLTWYADGATVNDAINSGADDIITMPLSIGMLKERIRNMVENRKDFVVTSNYIGPDRRGGERREYDELGTTRVPNSLRYKAVGDDTAAARPEAVRSTERQLTSQRIHRLAARISHLASDVKEHALVFPANPLPLEAADEIESLLTQINGHVENGEYVHLRDLNSSMHRIVSEILGAREVDPRLFDILELHGQAIRAALYDSASAAKLVTDALDKAARFLKRREASSGGPRAAQG